MEYRAFGNTGLSVSALGFGAGHIGDPATDESKTERLLNGVLDMGINLIDTARSYGKSEERIGRLISHRRKEFILSTKVGYNYKEMPDWSFEATMGTIDEALKALRTDYLDIVHLHSCDKQFLEEGSAISALEKAKEMGKIRVIAYSGENEALAYALASDRFGSIQCSFSIFDQQGIDRILPRAIRKDIGIIAKRPLGNSVWRYQARPDGHGHAIYWDRMQEFGLKLSAAEWHQLALRFTISIPGVGSLITGTSDIEHIKENLKLIDQGPLDQGEYDHLRSIFKEHAHNWHGLI